MRGEDAKTKLSLNAFTISISMIFLRFFQRRTILIIISITKIENKWIPRILFCSPRSLGISAVETRHTYLSAVPWLAAEKFEMKRNPQSGERKKAQSEEEKIEARKISTERNRVCMTLEREHGLHNPLTSNWSDSEGLRISHFPSRILGGKVRSEENGGEKKRTENEIGGGNRNTLWHRNKLTYFLAAAGAAYPCSKNEQSCRIRILNRSLAVSRIESRS